MFEVGDKVKIRTDLVPNELYDGLAFAKEMMEFCDREAEIVEVDEDGDYFIDLDEKTWSWNDEMFEKEVSDDAKFRAFLEEVANVDYNNYNEEYEMLKEIMDSFTYEGKRETTIEKLCVFWKDFTPNTRKKMTVEEIEKELGYKIEVVE